MRSPESGFLAGGGADIRVPEVVPGLDIEGGGLLPLAVPLVLDPALPARPPVPVP